MSNNDNQDFDDDRKNDELETQNTSPKNENEKDLEINKTSFVDLSMRNVDEILYNDKTHIIKVPVVGEMKKSYMTR